MNICFLLDISSGLKVAVGQKFPKKTEMTTNEQKMNEFLCYLGPQMADEIKTFQEELDPLH